MNYFWAYSWVLIPIAGVVAGMWKEWLKFKTQQNDLGNSTKQLESDVTKLAKQLEADNKALTQRVQNLEAIVTSLDWDHTMSLPTDLPRIEIDPIETSNEELVSQIARKVR